MPVDDQVPHIELARKIVRKFNEMYNTAIVEPEAVKHNTPFTWSRWKCQDGKSRGNAIYLSTQKKRLLKSYESSTDPARVTIDIPGTRNL